MGFLGDDCPHLHDLYDFDKIQNMTNKEDKNFTKEEMREVIIEVVAPMFEASEQRIEQRFTEQNSFIDARFNEVLKAVGVKNLEQDASIATNKAKIAKMEAVVFS